MFFGRAFGSTEHTYIHTQRELFDQKAVSIFSIPSDAKQDRPIIFNTQRWMSFYFFTTTSEKYYFTGILKNNLSIFFTINILNVYFLNLNYWLCPKNLDIHSIPQNSHIHMTKTFEKFDKFYHINILILQLIEILI